MIRFILDVIFVLIIIIVSLPLFIIELVIGLFSKKFRHTFAQAYVRLVTKVLLFISGTKLSVKGLENIPKEGPVLFVGNHRGIFDAIIALSLIKKDFGFIAKDELEHLPYLNIWMDYLNILFLDRTNNRKALKTILQAVEYIKEGTSMLIYPEGTRSKTKELLPFKEGSMKIAIKGGCPIVPIAMSGTDDIFENHFPRVTKEHVYVTFGEPIDPADFSKEEQASLGAYTRDIIKQFLDEHNN